MALQFQLRLIACNTALSTVILVMVCGDDLQVEREGSHCVWCWLSVSTMRRDREKKYCIRECVASRSLRTKEGIVSSDKIKSK